jgi:PTH1 family peptidyl-tRNA hydrolase
MQYLVVGLGNPTAKYAHNRHNVGFMVIDSLTEELSPTPINKAAFRGELAKTNDLLLLKPHTYMNLSGESVRAVYDYYKPDDIIVVHDDLDLPMGALRFKRGGGHGGHNGLKSIDKHLFNDYIRVRLGIGRPEHKSDVSNYVLHDFPKSQQACLNTIITKTKEAIITIKEESLESAQRHFSAKGC